MKRGEKLFSRYNKKNLEKFVSVQWKAPEENKEFHGQKKEEENLKGGKLNDK